MNQTRSGEMVSAQIGRMGVVRIEIGRKSKYLGSFKTEIEAHKSYMKEKSLITSKSN